MKTFLIVAALLIATSALAGTRDNDDTCDIKVGPAATLLLRYFEVDVTGTSGPTTPAMRVSHPHDASQCISVAR